MGKREVFFDGKTLMEEARVVHIKEMALDDPTVMKTVSYRKKETSENTLSI